MTVEHVETVTDPIVGHRVWRLDSKGMLFAISEPYTWNPGMNVATCRAVRHHLLTCRHLPSEPTPAFYCQCGLHLTVNASGLPRGWQEVSAIHGIVRAYGRIIEHTSGWRAEKAQILAIVKGHMTHRLHKQYRDIPLISAQESEKVIEKERRG